MAQTVYDRIKTMPKDELQKFLYYIYLCGHLNEQCDVDDEVYYKHVLDCPADDIDSLITWFETLEPVRLHLIPRDGREPYYLDTKFYSFDDAVSYINKYYRFVMKIGNNKYTTSTGIFTITPCSGKLS